MRRVDCLNLTEEGGMECRSEEEAVLRASLGNTATSRDLEDQKDDGSINLLPRVDLPYLRLSKCVC